MGEMQPWQQRHQRVINKALQYAEPAPQTNVPIPWATSIVNIYVRRATTQREEVVQDIHQLSEEDFDYFSLLIIKR